MLATRARLGMLLPRAKQPYTHISLAAVGSEQHLIKAVAAVEKGRFTAFLLLGHELTSFI